MSYRSEDYFGKRYEQKSIKDGLGVPLGSRSDDVKHYMNSENKWKKEVKDLKKQNKIIYIFSKKFCSRLELENIKKIRAKASKKRGDSIINSSSG